MTTAIVLLTRDLRVHDNPALTAAAATADRVLPLFVLDDGILRSPYNRPNRAHLLAACLTDVDEQLRRRGGRLVVRRGDVVAATARVARETGATAVHVSADVSGYAARRAKRLAADLPCELREHDGAVTVVPPGAVTTSDGSAYSVFTPYHRAWLPHIGWRPIAEPPERVTLPDGVESEPLPTGADICDGVTSPGLAPSGEVTARLAAGRWLADGVTAYEDRNDLLAEDGTSRLSPWLHFGALSAYELVARADRRRRGVDAFVRQLAWRDFHAQCLAARPDATRNDFRPRGDAWRTDDEELSAWRDGRTGYPVVDAAMRQLRADGWMHNRARLIAGSFLTKTLYIDWRLGAQHFVDWLADGDTSNNTMNWQWIAGTGTDTRPSRVLNPLRQAERYDPHGDYVRRYVPELRGIAGAAVHQPWELTDPPAGYPSPIVDLADGRRRFLAARG